MKLSPGWTAIAAGIGAGIIAFPQHAPAAAMEEIVVTARKVEENIQDVPVSVTAVSGEQIDDAVIFDFEDISLVTPGFTTYPSASNETALALTIRGQVQNDVLITLDPSVAVYLDGLYVARAYGLNADLVDLDSVQLLKGPQGTLFGRNATGGAMLLKTRDPELQQTSADVSITGLGDYEAASGVVNLPLGDLAALRFAVAASERDDYIENVTTGNDVGGYETLTYRAKLRIAPTDSLDMVLSYDAFEHESKRSARNLVWADNGPASRLAGEFANVRRFDKNDDEVANTFDPRTEAKTETISLVVDYAAPFGDLKLTAGHREVETEVHFDLDGSVSAVHGTHGQADMEQDSVELQLTTVLFDDRLKLVAGGLWFEEQGLGADFTSGRDENSYSLDFPPNLLFPGQPAIRASAIYWGDVEVESLGAYLQGTYALDDASNLTVGVRYSEDDKTLVQRAGFTGSLPTASLEEMGNNMVNPIITGPCLNDSTLAVLCQKDLVNEDDAWSWTVGYDRRLSEQVMLYAKVSEGYRSGGFNIRTSGGGELPFEPEITTEYEVGAKTDLFDGRVRWNSALYYSMTDDKQVSTIMLAAGGQATTVVLNAAETEVRGFETELTALLSENWTLSATYAYTDAEYDSYTDAAGNELDPTPRIQLVPNNEFSLGLTFFAELSFAHLSAHALYHWVDEMHTTDVAAFVPTGDATEADFLAATTSDSLGTVNLRLTLTSKNERYSASLWGRNVFDERGQINGLALAVANYDYVSATYNEPATYGLTLSANF